MTNGKLVKWDATLILSNDSDDKFYVLNAQEASFLLTPITQASWSTRWINEPIGFDRDEFIGQINERLMLPIDLCIAIADCIENNADTQQAIANAINNSLVIQNALQNQAANYGYGGGAGTPTTVSPDANDNNLLPAGYTCDNDHLFGMAMEVVRQVHENTEEILQEINANAGDYLNLFNSIVDNFPAVEAIGILTEYADWVIDTIGSDYDTAWSTVVQQDIACEIFCKIKDDCSLSWDDIWDTYFEIADMTNPSTDDLLSYMNAIMTGSLTTNKQTVALVDMVGLAAMRFGGKFVDWIAGIRSMETTIALAADETDSDWAILCTDCGGWCVEFIFTDNNGGFALNTASGFPSGTYSASGWETNYTVQSGGTFEEVLDIIKTPTLGGTLTSYEYEYDCSYTEIGAAFSRTTMQIAGSTIFDNRPPTQGTGIIVNGSGSWSINGDIRLFANQGVRDKGDGTFLLTWKRLKLSGTGTNPFISYVCT